MSAVVIVLLMSLGLSLSSCNRTASKLGSVSVEGEIEFADSEFSVIHLARLQPEQEQQLKELLDARSDEWFVFHDKFESIITGSKRIAVPIESRKFSAQVDPGTYVAYAHFKGFSKVYLLDLTSSKSVFLPGKFSKPSVVKPL
jgi:hypothetical protein